MNNITHTFILIKSNTLILILTNLTFKITIKLKFNSSQF